MASAPVSPQHSHGRRALQRASLGWQITGGKQISRHGCCSRDKGTASTVSAVPIKENKSILHLFLLSFRVQVPSQMQAGNASKAMGQV